MGNPKASKPKVESASCLSSRTPVIVLAVVAVLTIFAIVVITMLGNTKVDIINKELSNEIQSVKSQGSNTGSLVTAMNSLITDRDLRVSTLESQVEHLLSNLIALTIELENLNNKHIGTLRDSKINADAITTITKNISDMDSDIALLEEQVTGSHHDLTKLQEFVFKPVFSADLKVQQATYTIAQQQCDEANQGFLAYPQSAKEWADIKQLVMESGVPDGTVVFMGIRRHPIEEESWYQYGEALGDGTYGDYDADSTYIDEVLWGEGEPNQDTGDCVVWKVGMFDDLLMTADCEEENNYVCASPKLLLPAEPELKP